MTDLDRRVAKWRGWDQHRIRGWIDTHGTVAAGHDYSPETNLLQAYQLWDEARPEGWWLIIKQDAEDVDVWQVIRRQRGIAHGLFVPLTDLPRAITQSWIDAMNKE